MSKILLISGSPRKGNTEYILSETKKLLRKAGQAAELVLLRKKKIKECLGCLSCQKALACQIHDDDMKVLNQKLVNSDCIIVGSPTYFDMISGLLKKWIDRTNPLYPNDLLRGKLGAIIAVGAAGRQSIGQAAENIKRFFKIHRVKIIQVLLFEAEYVDEVKHNQLYRKKIKMFSQEIIADLNHRR